MTLIAEWEQFSNWAQLFGAPLDSGQLAQFAAYQSLLIDWNERVNLTAIRDPAEIRIRHFLDAISCASVTGDLNGRSLIDVGTGAGFPGLPLKILFPELQLTLVESVHKKEQFLQAVVDTLALDEVTIMGERAERLGQSTSFREQYDWAAARAVAEMRTLAEYLLPFCKIGGKALAQKGAGVGNELAKAEEAIRLLGGGKPEIAEVILPQKQQLLYIVTVEKIELTPGKYPRRVGVPAKRPL